MKHTYILKAVFMAVVLCNSFTAQNVVTYTHTGAMQSFTVPGCVTQITIEARGATGGNGGVTPGYGATVKGVLTTTPGAVLNIFVGGQGSVTAGGFNGGGNGGTSSSSAGAGGGGASDIRLNGVALTDRIIVAAGGGGSGGGTSYSPYGGNGGGGSSFTSASGFGGAGGQGCATGGSGGQAGGTATSYGSGGGGAGYTSGGGSGGAGSSTGGYGCAGTLGGGGNGGGTSPDCGGATGGVNGGGGGGGGYYGGGGGMTGTGGCNGGGGGGSSYGNSTLFSNLTYTAGNITGHGQITLSYNFNGSTVSIAPTNPMICTGSSITLGGSGAVSYTWNTGAQTQSITVSPSVNTSYTLEGTNSLGCISQAVVTVTASSGTPVLSVTSSTNSTCLGKNVTLTATGALSYTWSHGVTNGVAFTPSATASYTVQGENGCGITTSVTTVTVAPLPVSALASPIIVCAGKPTTLTAAGAPNFTWMPNNVSGQTVVTAPMMNTIYTVTASDGTCTGSATVAVNTMPNPTIQITGTSNNVCAGESVTITVTGGDTYSWTPSTITGTMVVVTPTAPTAYQVNGSNSFGCVAGDNFVVVTKESPTLSIAVSPTMVCAGGTATLQASGANTYEWDGVPGNALFTVNPNTPTTYTLKGTSNSTQCSATKTAMVNVFLPTVNASAPATICPGGVTTLTISTGTSVGQSTVVSPAAPTVYTLTMNTTSAGIVCPASATVLVDLWPKPAVLATASRTRICRTETSVLTATGATSYTWTNVPATSVNSQTVLVKPNVAANYTYMLSGIDQNGCKNTSSVVIQVQQCLAVDENVMAGIKIYPNPSSGQFIVQSEDEVSLRIYNGVGQFIRTLELSDNKSSEVITGLPAGIYFITTSDKADTSARKIVITE